MLSSHLSPSLDEFDSVQATFKFIKIINNIPNPLRYTLYLNLTGNHIMTLNGIQQFMNLQVFIIDYNLINLPKEFEKITNKFFMKEISFIGNPVFWLMESKDLVSMGFNRISTINEPRKYEQINDSLKETRTLKKITKYDSAQDQTKRTYGTSNRSKNRNKNDLTALSKETKVEQTRNSTNQYVNSRDLSLMNTQHKNTRLQPPVTPFRQLSPPETAKFS